MFMQLFHSHQEINVDKRKIRLVILELNFIHSTSITESDFTFIDLEVES